MPNHTPTQCAVPQCNRNVLTATLCGRHYQQKQKGLDPFAYDFIERRCSECDVVLAPWLSRGMPPVTCSPECKARRASNYDYRNTPSYRAKAAARAATVYRCITCDAYLRTGDERGSRKYCPPCAQAVRRAQPKGSPTRICEQPGCTRGLQARGRCSAHYKVWLREQGRMGQSGWDARRKANRAVRDQHMASRRTGINPTVARLVARDGTDCGWCGQPLDMALTYPHRMYRTIDHVVPLSKGGEHSMDNTRLLHWTCNSARSNSDAVTKSNAMSD
jgi:5-methylcytosine-specific restriction endonuclease McrA